MKKTGIIAIAVGALLVAGGGTAFALNGVSTPAPEAIAQTSSTDASTSTPIATTPSVDITAPGQVCDIKSMHTTDCETQYPETGFLNGVHRVTHGMDATTDAAFLAYGRAACDAFKAGTATMDINVVPEALASAPGYPENSNNEAVRSAAQLILCPEFKDR